MSRKALIVYGGWEGHQPEAFARLFEEMLVKEGFEVQSESTLNVLRDAPNDLDLSLIVPIWTMGTIEREDLVGTLKAVENGVGMAGCHGGMGDAFRADPEWNFLTGGQFVAHPGDDKVRYRVTLKKEEHPIVKGLRDFDAVSEQYYLHTDPGNEVLATCRFPSQGVYGPHVRNPCDMPVAWTKSFGKGRVFYCALGHHISDINLGTPREIMRRGFVWAAKD